MKCERCHQREATIHLSQTFQGKTVEQNLCETCARELGLDSKFESVFSDLFGQPFLGGNIFNTTGGIPAFGKPVTRELRCSHCGQTYEEFSKTGLFGCSHCYEAYADRLDQVFRRVQSGTRHVGHKLAMPATRPGQGGADQTVKQAGVATPAGTPSEQQVLQQQLADLRARQQQAVKDEDYEQAAHLRDEIKAIEQKLAAAAAGDAAGTSPGSGRNDSSGKKTGGKSGKRADPDRDRPASPEGGVKP